MRACPRREGLPGGPESLPEGPEGLPGAQGERMDGRTDGISPHSTGLCPLSGPLLNKRGYSRCIDKTGVSHRHHEYLSTRFPTFAHMGKLKLATSGYDFL